jgi:hypothetical protein
MGLTAFPNGISSFGVPIYGYGQDISGSTYFVDGNSGLDSNDGSSWEKAFKTVAKGLAISHADIARGSDRWARRNTVYIAGDSFEENLTKLAQKTDVIGMGSCDYLPMARIIGNHPIGSVGYDGCRFINVGFKSPAAGGDIITLNNYHNGISFLGCDFNGNSTTAATGAIVATACESLTIKNCVFDGPFSDAVIELGAGETNSLLIQGNIIAGADEGIMTSATLTTTVRAGWIIGNYIKSTLCCINDTGSNVLHVVGNRGITLADHGVVGAGAIVCNSALALDNQFTSSSQTFYYPLAFGSGTT